jgi:alpha-beta hydrolase superfamily lysophospholipase
MTDNFHGKQKALRTALIIVLVSVLVFSAGSLFFIRTLYEENFPRYDKPKYSGYLQFSDVPGYARSVVKFPSGKTSLAGYIFGEENTKGLVVIAPGRGEGAEHYLAQMLYFVDQGWRVFSFDYTGSYASEGENSVGLPQSRIDLEAALAYIQSDIALRHLPVVLWGHSWGGYAVAAVLKDHPEISAVASISGFNSPLGLMDEQVRNRLGVPGYVEYPYEWAYQTMRFGRSAGMTAIDSINSVGTPVMIIHGSTDDAISYNGASIIAQRGRITNPNVVYLTRSAANRSGHMDLFQSEAAIQYINQKNQEYKALYERYSGAIPDSVKSAYYAGVNRFQTSELDAEFMGEINSFFERSLLEPE